MKATGIFSEKGFTLLEVMIALAVVAIALVSLLSLGNRTIGLHAEQQALTLATMLAERKMTEVETLYHLNRSPDITNEGVFAEPFDRYRWRIAYDDTVLPEVLQVTVMVLWGAGEKMEKVDLVSFVLREGR